MTVVCSLRLFVGGGRRGGGGGGGLLEELVLHLGPLDVNAGLAEQHDAVEQLQGDQPEEGDSCR